LQQFASVDLTPHNAIANTPGDILMKIFLKSVIAVLLLSCSTTTITLAGAQQQPRLGSPSERGRATVALADEVRRRLVTLGNHGVFDWLEAVVQPDDTVILRGQASRPILKSDAEAVVKRIESVAKVVNEIEVLPQSTNDDEIRMAVYRSIFTHNSPLFQYAIRAVPPIHIIVKNGNVTLKGVVAREMDRQLALMAARSVSGVFDVKNELLVEALEVEK
jgi:hyperosmotically inducible protein